MRENLTSALRSSSAVVIMLVIGYVVLEDLVRAEPSVVILVRHAEKSKLPADNPVLSSLGKDRAKLLARMVVRADIKAIYATEATRTRETVEPLSKKIDIPITLIPAGDLESQMQAILQHDGGVVIVCGHSNTIPQLIHALGGTASLSIKDNEFDKMFLLSQPKSENASTVILRY